jgi:hypothetical protein
MEVKDHLHVRVTLPPERVPLEARWVPKPPGCCVPCPARNQTPVKPTASHCADCAIPAHIKNEEYTSDVIYLCVHGIVKITVAHKPSHVERVNFNVSLKLLKYLYYHT